MKDKVVKTALKIYYKFPFLKIFKSPLSKFYKKHLLKNQERGIVETEVNGIKYKLDLSEYIDSYIYNGNYEMDSNKLVKKYVKHGMIVMDAGANMGYFTLMFAKIVGTGRVYSFEPSVPVFKKMEENIKLNGFRNIIAENKALSDVDKIDEGNFVYSFKHGGNYTAKKEEKCEFITLDKYFKDNDIQGLDFAKIDIDGFEEKMIRGSIETLKRFKPILLLEVSISYLQPKAVLISMLELLKSIGYGLYDEHERETTIEKIMEENERIGGINVLLKHADKK